MFGTSRGTLVPARHALLAFIVVLSAAAPIAARADDGMVDVHTLPQLEGAAEDTARIEPYNLKYRVPAVVAVTTPATRKLLTANGWQEFVYPDPSNRPISFKKGPQGLTVTFSQVPRQPDQSVVYYTANRLYNNVPFPDDATDIVFDDRRPYLSCITAATVESGVSFFRQGLLAAGWTTLSAADIATRWPNAKIDQTVANGAVAYYGNDVSKDGPKHLPIMVTLRRRDDGRTSVEIRIAPFMQPQNLARAKDEIGLPVPDHTMGFGSTGSSDSVDRKVEGKVEADLSVVLAFYRRELAAQGWKELADGAVIKDSDATLYFSSADQDGRLTLNHKYDLTFATLNTRVKESALAARAKAKKEADEKFFRDAQTTAQQLMVADEARRVALAANLSDAPMRALADASKPVPLPEGAENVEFDSADGRLEFKSGSSVKALAAFHRGSMKSLGWKEDPFVIDKPNMVVVRFTKSGKQISFTVMQMGPKVNVTAEGSGLVMADAKSAAPAGQVSSAAAAKAAVQDLEAEPDSALPVPKQHTMSSIGTGKMPGSEAPFRRELDASIPAELNSVLAFYRSELGKRGWKETAERAVVKPDQVQLAFSSPDGPALLKLGRSNDETSVKLAQKYPASAAKADIIPKPGQARLVFGNMGGSEVALSINKQAIKIVAGAGGPGSPKPPMLDLPPGKYPYSVKVAGRPVRNDTIEVTADDTWGLMIAPSGEVLSLQMY